MTNYHMLWRWRNQRKHNEEYVMPSNLLNDIKQKINTYKISQSMIQNVHMKKKNTQLICWSSPNDPWIRLNMNEVIKENLKVCY